MTDQTFIVRFTVDGGSIKTRELSGVDASFIEKRIRAMYPKKAVVAIESITVKGESLTDLLDKTFPEEKGTKTVKKTAAAKKPAKTAEKPAPKPEKKAAAKKPEKPVKAAKKVVHYPIADLSKMEFVPKWVYANLPEKPHQPAEGEFSYVMVYKLVRSMEPNYVKLPVDVLFDMLGRYVAEHQGTPLAEWWGKDISAAHKRDLKARLHWCIVETLKRLDKTEGAK